MASSFPALPLFLQPEEYHQPLVVLKEGELFLVQTLDGAGGSGIYYQDTRFLNGVHWRLNGQPLVVLSGSRRHGARGQLDLTNPDSEAGERFLAARSIYVQVVMVVARAVHMRMRVVNFTGEPLDLDLELGFTADFRDIFEVRGMTRAARGRALPVVVEEDRAVLGYDGRDGAQRTTEICFEPVPDAIGSARPGELQAVYRLHLPPRTRVFRYLTVRPRMDSAGAGAPAITLRQEFSRAALAMSRQYRDWDRGCTRIETDNAQYNSILRQATNDMRALLTTYPGQGRIVDAGIPWYVAPFGRDSMITGLETLILTPDIARDSLRFLARFQGQADDPWRDEEPGKILHELRRGEMARAGEIPHTPYYGSIDSTLWWIITLYRTWRFANDRQLVEELADPLWRATQWIWLYGDRDGDGLIEYLCRSPLGLVHQGWKDSHDSVLDEAGNALVPPIAPVEVQGYAYLALRGAARLLEALGQADRARQAETFAERVRSAFLARFYDPATHRVAYALDGAKRPVFMPASNLGHLLFTGILPSEVLPGFARRLLHPDMSSGFGIRTLSQEAPYYNPMSYHNGSVWPHDTALIAWGLKEVGEHDLLQTVVRQLYDASLHFPDGRLPELYCGFMRRVSTGPVPYPVACNPQAWSAAVPFFLLQVSLGIVADGSRVAIRHPHLPPWLNQVYLQNLRIGGGTLDIEFSRGRGTTYANVVRTDGDLQISIEPVATRYRL